MTPRSMNKVLKLSLLFLGLLTVAVLYFANARLTNIAKETAKVRAEVEAGHQQIETYQQTKAKVDSLGYVTELANKVLPKDPDQSAAVAELSQFAVRSGLQVSQITFVDAGKTTPTSTSSKDSKKKSIIPKGVTIVPVEIQLLPGANYNSLLDFLKSIENNRRKTQITSITIAPDVKDRSKLSQVTIDLNLYAKQAKTETNK